VSNNKVGERVLAKPSDEGLVQAEIKAIINTTEGVPFASLVLEKRSPGFTFGRLSRSCGKIPQ